MYIFCMSQWPGMLVALLCAIVVTASGHVFPEFKPVEWTTVKDTGYNTLLLTPLQVCAAVDDMTLIRRSVVRVVVPCFHTQASSFVVAASYLTRSTWNAKFAGTTRAYMGALGWHPVSIVVDRNYSMPDAKFCIEIESSDANMVCDLGAAELVYDTTLESPDSLDALVVSDDKMLTSSSKNIALSTAESTLVPSSESTDTTISESTGTTLESTSTFDTTSPASTSESTTTFDTTLSSSDATSSTSTSETTLSGSDTTSTSGSESTETTTEVLADDAPQPET